VQLQSAKQRFEAKGLKLAAVSYDSPAILKDFAERHKIEFPLLADPNSEIIRRFNVLNTEAKGMTKGTSGVSSKAANWGQIKTGQRKWPGTVRGCTRS
jgi:peroxiredoxin